MRTPITTYGTLASAVALLICLSGFSQISIEPTEPLFLLEEIVEDTNLTFLVTNGHDEPKTVLLLKHTQCAPDEWVDLFCDDGFCYSSSVNEIEINLEANETREYGITVEMNEVNGWAYFKVKASDINNLDDFEFADIYVNTEDCMPLDLPSMVYRPLDVYPNPVSTTLSLDINNLASVEAIDISGRRFALNFSGRIVHVQGLSPGIFQLIAKSMAGEIFISKLYKY